MRWAPSDLETIACDLCTADLSRKVFSRPDGLDVHECPACGLAYLNPRPRSERIGQLYERTYFETGGADSRIGYAGYVSESNRAELLAIAQTRLDTFVRLAGALPRTNLEIGCATGEFASLLVARGASVVGIDLSAYAIEEAQRRHPGLDFRRGEVSDLAGRDRFVGVFAFEVIEHVPSPRAFFSDLGRLVQPNGFLVLTTPNLDCGRALGFEHWSGLQTSFEHLYFFDAATLARFAQEAGFDVVAIATGGGRGARDIGGDVGGAPAAAPAPTARDRLRGALTRTGLLALARSVRDRASRFPVSYRRGGRGHNLYCILRRKAHAGPQ